MAKGKHERWLTEEGLLMLEAWARNGLIDEQIAHNMGIVPSTLYTYKNKYKEIEKALSIGKDPADIKVENALYKKALGYSYEEVTREMVRDKKTNKPKLVVTKIVTKEVPPDTGAICYWLKNRKPEQWRDKKEISLEGSVELKQMTDEQLEEQTRKLEAKLGLITDE